MSDVLSDPEDSIDPAHALDEARATLAQLQVENEALRRKAGGPEMAARPLPAGYERADAAAYRVPDRHLRLERELHDTNVEIANLSIENAILQSQLASRRPTRPSPLVPVVATLSIAGAGVAIWFGTENFGMLLMAALLLGLGYCLYRLIGTIQPDGRNPPTPPQLPSGWNV
ncbi:Hypothetical protein A7982_10251 [Minicystis rosea]|nr:Hypothetical protein A7982_10251 [Minicystis rosea]